MIILCKCGDIMELSSTLDESMYTWKYLYYCSCGCVLHVPVDGSRCIFVDEKGEIKKIHARVIKHKRNR